MESITNFVRLYVNEEILGEIATEARRDLVPSIRKYLYKGHGYDTGHLFANINSYQTPSKVTGNTGVIMIVAEYTPDYGKYVNDDGASNHWKGYHFMEHGLDDTIEKIMRLY